MIENHLPWRNIVDEPPPQDKFVLGYFPDFNQIKICKLVETDWYDDNENLIDDPDYFPTHWIPLPTTPPKKYKEKEEKMSKQKELEKLVKYQDKMIELADAYNELAEKLDINSRVAVLHSELDEDKSIDDYCDETPYASYLAGNDTGWFPSGLNC